MERTQRWLRWLYTGRLVLATAIFVAALAQWFSPDGSPFETLVATIALLTALGMTAFGLWSVELRERPPQRTFLYLQVLYDVVLVTAAVHVTGGPLSPFPPLYILVITAGALLLPLPGGMLIGALASMLFFGDVVFLHPIEPATQDFLRIVLFCVMAVAMAAVGDRLRRTGSALGAVESELRQLRLETGDILDGIDTALVTVDGAGRLQYMNRAAVKLLGIGSDDIEVRPVLEELERSAPGLGRLMRRTAATRVPVGRFEIRRNTPAGVRYLSVRTTVLEAEGSELSVTAVIQDISEGRQIDELIHRAERLEAVAALGASLAHEIKNPLASIRSAAEQLGSPRLGAEDREKLNGLIVAESERLSRLLTEFMDFSRFDAQRWSSVDLGRLAGEVIELVRRHPDRTADKRIDYARPTEPVVVDGDHDLLHRAVFNLVLNAVQHAGPDGVVRVDVDHPNGDIPPSVQLPEPVRVRVRDSGSGIQEEDIPRMFDPFFTRRSGGTGLGLALVHRAVEAHRGAILVDSPAGAGACFTIYLPAHAGRELGDGDRAS